MSGQPGNRAQAPGSVALLQSFVNTRNVEFGQDRFSSTEGLAEWLRRHDLGGPDVRPDELDLADAKALREALRAVLWENNGAPPDPRARRTIEHVARDCPLVVVFGADGRPALRPALPDVRGALAAILALTRDAVADGSWQRLKTCGEHRCEWVFYDRSRNRSSRWCSMAGCGTRAKMQTYREARRTGAAQS